MISFKEFKNRNENKKLPLREQFYRGLIFNVGDIVESTSGTKFEILSRGTNYVTSVNEDGTLSKWFIDKLTPSNESLNESDMFSFKGYIPGEVFQSNDDVIDAFSSTISRIQDGIAIVRLIREATSYLESNSEEDRDTLIEHLEQLDEYQYHESYLNKLKENMNIKSTDKLKVASMIATAYGIPEGTNPDAMVTAAIRKARKDPNWSKTKAILQGMLGIALEVGIKFDLKSADMAPGWDYTKMDKALSDADGSSFDPHHLMKNKSLSEGYSEDDIALGGTVIYKHGATHKLAKAKQKSTRSVTTDSGHTVPMYHVVSTDASDWNHYKDKPSGLKESESLDELSIGTLNSYTDKAKASAVKLGNQGAKAKNVDTAYKKFAKAGDRLNNVAVAKKKVFGKEWKQRVGLSEEELTEACNRGSNVKVESNGRTMYGKVKGVHGSVVEVSHKNGKVGFYHSHKISITEEGGKDSLSYDDISAVSKTLNYAGKPSSDGKPKLPSIDKMSKTISYSGEEDDPIMPTGEFKSGSSLNPTSDSDRMMKVQKLKGNL